MPVRSAFCLAYLCETLKYSDAVNGTITMMISTAQVSQIALINAEVSIRMPQMNQTYPVTRCVKFQFSGSFSVHGSFTPMMLF